MSPCHKSYCQIWLGSLLLLLLWLLLSASVTPAAFLPMTITRARAQSVPPWAMYGHDAQHSSHSTVRDAQTPTIQWRYPVARGRVINMASSVDIDGTVYIGTWGDRCDGFFPGNLYAITADGLLKWAYTPPEPEQDSTGRCCICGVSTLYVGVLTPQILSNYFCGIA